MKLEIMTDSPTDKPTNGQMVMRAHVAIELCSKEVSGHGDSLKN